LTQNWNCGHARPQPPQLLGSVRTSTQVPLQSFVSDPQTHRPPWQSAPAPHEWPHDPQFVGSVFVSAQSPLHDVSPVAHAHVPPLQS
jgi:hypothetical protein